MDDWQVEIYTNLIATSRAIIEHCTRELAGGTTPRRAAELLEVIDSRSAFIVETKRKLRARPTLWQRLWRVA